MYRSHQAGTPEARRGIILLVVLFMLTLFAIAGLSLVLYADAEATAARLHRDANTLVEVPDMEPEQAFSFFLGQLIFDSWDDESGVYSALRGHSLARTMYGMNTIIDPTSDRYITSDPPIPPATARTQLNTVPFNGTGRLHEPIAIGGQPVDGYYLVNYTYHPTDGFLRDPERLGVRNPPGLRPFMAPAPRPPDNRGEYAGGFNAPYTYPDLNNMFLAQVASNGQVTLPSFHRPWLDPNDPNKYFGPLNRGNTHWQSAIGKYLILRPRPIDQKRNPNDPNEPELFPYPDDPGGDVKNLVNAPGGNDSIWIDIGAPVLTLPGGRKYKMLVAPLIVDLDGRLNVNLHGNFMGPDQTHASNQGWGPWEVNLSLAMPGGGGTEWRNLFLGTQTATPRLHGKYGANQVPTNPGTNVGALRPPHYYAQIDYNGRRDTASTTPVAGERLRLPGDGGANPLNCFPGFPNGRYVNGVAAVERRDHAREYNAFRAVTFAPANDDRVFAASNMAALLRFNDMGSEALTSELLRLCPDNFITSPNADRLRRLVTTHSFDLNQAGVTPYIYNRVGQPSYVSGPDPTRAPVGSALDFPPLDWRLTPPADLATAYPYSEFQTRTWRAQLEQTLALSDVGRINLNRLAATASSYPHYRTGLSFYQVPFNGRFDGYDPNWPPPPPPPPPPAPVPPPPPPTPPQQFGIAQRNRQILVNDLYRRLLAVTGAPPAANPLDPTDAELAPRRWLAQLAVNLVDYIDEDEAITPFNFYTEEDVYPQGRQPNDPPFDIGRLGLRDPNDAQSADPELPRYWVFGTELPKIVVNEVLVEHRIPATPTEPQYPVHVWVELHNPMQTVPGSLGLVAQAGFPVRLKVDPLQAPLTSATNNPQNDRQFFPYRVVVANQILSRPDNVLGTPDIIRTETKDTQNTPNGPFDFDNPVQRINNTPQPPLNRGGVSVQSPYIDGQITATADMRFFLIGPANDQGTGIDDARNTIRAAPGGRVPPLTPYLRSPNMKYEARVQDGVLAPDDRPTGVTVLLRRLANPHLPPNNQPTLGGQVNQPNPWYNPYITVDYLEAIPLRDGTSTDLVYASRGKRQPYAAFLKRTNPPGTDAAPDSPVVDQELTQPPPPPPADPPLRTIHNFGQVNTPTPLTGRYEWLVHLDRELISPPELLHVSGYPPHLLTQRFFHAVPDPNDPNNTIVAPFQHYVPWFDQGAGPWASPTLPAGSSHRLYRLFEHLQCYDRIAGVGSAEAVRRIPGKININGIWDPEVFHALCDAANDPNNPNYFDQGHVQEIFTRMMARRSPNFPTGGPGPNDRPFLSIAAGLSPQGQQYPNGLGGIEETMLASDGSGTGRRLLQPPIPPATDPASHPYVQMQLLTKIFDQVTTRSNVFAVWATVGFFEVTDDTSRPMKLGAELGRAEGRNIRHRMFAIIDRTQLTQYTGPQVRFNPTGNLVLVPYFSIIK